MSFVHRITDLTTPSDNVQRFPRERGLALVLIDRVRSFARQQSAPSTAANAPSAVTPVGTELPVPAEIRRFCGGARSRHPACAIAWP
jgi:hypothetical protein